MTRVKQFLKIFENVVTITIGPMIGLGPRTWLGLGPLIPGG